MTSTVSARRKRGETGEAGAARPRSTGGPTLVRVNIVLPVVLGLIGVAFATVGVLGARGRLNRNRFFGVRTKATLRDDEAFALANKVAGVPNAAAGAIALVAGAATAANPTSALVIGLVGLVGSVAVAGAGCVLGHR
ncbi:MAG: SdpI family protein, partial [Saccharothrix sp.]|nr:SdpI family protein [Saccharothrix sp.]